MTDAILARAAGGERISRRRSRSTARRRSRSSGPRRTRSSGSRYGDDVTYNVNAHLNPTNICVVGCGFCAFAVWTEKDERAYAYSVDQLVDRAVQLAELGITELHIVGGMTKEYDLPYYEELFRELKATLPHVSLTALTAVEVDFIASLSKVSSAEALRRLGTRGTTMPGGGAGSSAPACAGSSPTARCPPRPGWRCIARPTAGARTNATPCSATSRRPRSRWTHAPAPRPAGRHGGFQAFIPLPFLPGNTDFAYLPGPTREEKLRTIAVARLFLDSFPHIKGHWVMLGEEITSEALGYGSTTCRGR